MAEFTHLHIHFYSRSAETFMKLSFSTLACPGYSFSEIYTMAKDLGFDAIELRGVVVRDGMPNFDIAEGVSSQKANCRRDLVKRYDRALIPCFRYRRPCCLRVLRQLQRNFGERKTETDGRVHCAFEINQRQADCPNKMLPKVNDKRITVRKRSGKNIPNWFSRLDAPPLECRRISNNFHKPNRRNRAREQPRPCCLRLFEPSAALFGNMDIPYGGCGLSA